MSGELRSRPSYSSRISSIIAATSAAPPPVSTNTCRKSTGRMSSSAATITLLPRARRTRPCDCTLYDAVMQQTRARLAIRSLIALSLAAGLFLAGCSKSSEEASKPLPDAATLLKESSETTKAQTSVHLKLAVQGEIKELPIESLEGDLTQAPAVAAQGKVNINFLGQKLDGVEFVVSDGNLYGALTAG